MLTNNFFKWTIAVVLLAVPITGFSQGELDNEGYQQSRIRYRFDHFRWGCEADPPAGNPTQCHINDIELQDSDTSVPGGGTKKFRLYSSIDLQMDEASIVPKPQVEHAVLIIPGSLTALKYKYGENDTEEVLKNSGGAPLVWEVEDGDLPDHWVDLPAENDIIELEWEDAAGNDRFFFYIIEGYGTSVIGPGTFHQFTVSLIDDSNNIQTDNLINTFTPAALTAGQLLKTRVLKGRFASINAKAYFNFYLNKILDKNSFSLNDPTDSPNFPYVVASVHFPELLKEGKYYKEHLSDHYKHCIRSNEGSDCYKWKRHWRRGISPRFCDPADDEQEDQCEPGNEDHTSIDFIDEAIDALSNRELFPNLKSVVMLGHSAGGQFINRYVALGKGEELFEDASISMRYVPESPGKLMYPSPNRIFHNDGAAAADDDDAEVNPFLLQDTNNWRELGSSDDYYYNDPDDNDPNDNRTYYNDYRISYAERTGMCYDDTIEPDCHSPYGSGGYRDDGEQKYGDFKEVILRRLQTRDIVMYVGGEEICEDIPELRSQGNNHVYRTYAYYLLFTCQ